MPRLWIHWLCALSLLTLTAGPSPADDAEKAEKTETSVETDAGDATESAEKEEDGEDALPAGHSGHGEVFNEGPRQRAYLMEGTGNVHFPITTKVPQVQQLFDQGIGQLHGFWYFEAERSFRQAATLDPDCAMAYWGMAMSNLGNQKRARGFIAEAAERKANATPREGKYIDGIAEFVKEGDKKKKDRYVAWIEVLEEILYEHPEDLEAKAFLTLALYNGRSSGASVPSNFAADALFKEILAENPMHPVHHFRIHWWDRERAAMALESAALCGQSAPRIAHMWHMPGHIYSKLKRYEDAAWQQEASARVDHANMIRDRVMPDQIHNFAHNNEWLIRDLSHLGRVSDAVDLAKNMIEMPRHPDYNTLAKRGSTYYGRLRLFEVLSRYELHEEMIALCNSSYLPPTEQESEQIKRLRMLGTAYYAVGDAENGDQQLADLRDRIEKLKESQDEAGEKAAAKAKEDGKDEKAINKAKSDARRALNARVQRVQQAIHELEGRKTIAEGDPKAGLELLKKARGIDKSQLARVRFDAGEIDGALQDVRAEVKSKENQVHPQAVLVDLLWRSDKRDEAKQAFTKLRETSRSIEVDSPVFARLAPVAEEMGLPENWQLDRPQPTDVGERPSLESLGPFRWRPSPAPDWTLKDAKEKDHTLRQFRGKPFVLIFYLGHGCLHCAEQLQAFGPKAEEFEKLGMPLVAISTDDHEGLNTSIDNYTGGEMPIQLLTNANLDVFKAYRCFDDFEQQPLHGTFVIDAEGLVRWQDISYEPEMDPNFVLKEAERLLAQTPNGPTPAPSRTADASTDTADTEAVVVP